MLATVDSQNSHASHPFRWFPEFLEFGKRRFHSQGRVLAASVLVGIVAGMGGIVFSVAGQAVVQLGLEGVAGYYPPGPEGEVRFPWIPSFHASFNPWLLLVVPTIGGLLSGLLVYRYAPEAEGHGTDAAIAAYHEHKGYIRPTSSARSNWSRARSRSGREAQEAEKGRSPRSARGSGHYSGGCSGSGPRNGACCSRPGWARAWPPSSAHRWPGRCLRLRSSTAHPSSSPR